MAVSLDLFIDYRYVCTMYVCMGWFVSSTHLAPCGLKQECVTLLSENSVLWSEKNYEYA